MMLGGQFHSVCNSLGGFSSSRELESYQWNDSDNEVPWCENGVSSQGMMQVVVKYFCFGNDPKIRLVGIRLFRCERERRRITERQRRATSAERERESAPDVRGHRSWPARALRGTGSVVMPALLQMRRAPQRCPGASVRGPRREAAPPARPVLAREHVGRVAVGRGGSGGGRARTRRPSASAIRGTRDELHLRGTVVPLKKQLPCVTPGRQSAANKCLARR